MPTVQVFNNQRTQHLNMPGLTVQGGDIVQPFAASFTKHFSVLDCNFLKRFKTISRKARANNLYRGCASPGHLDQHLGPFYEAGLAAGGTCEGPAGPRAFTPTAYAIRGESITTPKAATALG